LFSPINSIFNSISRISLYLKVIWKLGLSNTSFIIWYRFTLKSGIRRWLFPSRPFLIVSDFFHPVATCVDSPEEWKPTIVKEADRITQGLIKYYSCHWKAVGSPPNWFLNPFNNKEYPEPGRRWTKLGDFNPGVGDIKNVWEPSRFLWLVTLAMAFKFCNNNIYLEIINGWLKDWAEKNPLNDGPNWKCGQEASIRVINVLLADYLLGKNSSSTDALIRFVTEHCERIEPNMRYAISQDNNHGTSEAAALFICGAWMKSHVMEDVKLYKKANTWEKNGRYWLENRVSRLIEDDGSFSQYSVNYHRLLIDTLSIVKFWQSSLCLDGFSDQFNKKARAAVNWLFQMVDPLSGDAPNIGANDGSLLFSLTSCDYRDFRPSVQLGSAIFFNNRAYGEGPWDEVLNCLNLDCPGTYSSDLRKKSLTLENGGYIIFHSDSSWGVVCLPNYRFRPGHADALHLDLWYRGENILRDGGSYSYNCEEPWQSYFPGTKSHNSIEFDDRDQMPRISRFLWGEWTKGKTIEPLTECDRELSWAGAYTDFKGCKHQRSLIVKSDCWQIKDIISGHKNYAVLRWRLLPGEWKLEGKVCRCRDISIEISGIAALELNLVDGWESRYYMQMSKLPVLEVLIEDYTNEITTTIRFGAH
jgi:hypothetical protein